MSTNIYSHQPVIRSIAIISSFILAAFSISHLFVVSAEPIHNSHHRVISPTSELQETGNAVATVSEIANVPSTRTFTDAIYFVTKKHSDSACSVLISGTSTELGACLLVSGGGSGYTRTTSTANYATVIAYFDSWCTVASSAAKTTFLSDSCSFDASSGYIKTTLTSTPTFASLSAGVIVSGFYTCDTLCKSQYFSNAYFQIGVCQPFNFIFASSNSGKSITATTYSTADCTGAISRTLTFSSGACGASQYYGFGQEIVVYVVPVSITNTPIAAVIVAPTLQSTLPVIRLPTSAPTLAFSSKLPRAPIVDPVM